MNTILVDPNICTFNKFQPNTRRAFTPEQLADLASIADIGFIHTPVGFKEDGTYMIIVGWRRRCAWMIYHPGEPMPMEIRDKPATDMDLYRLTVVENESRENFNAIQKAELAARAVELGMTQTQAGALFNPPLKQAAISHLLSLRRLPDEIKVHVESGAIPERIARELITPAKYMQSQAIKAATLISKADPANIEDVARMQISAIYRDNAQYLGFGYSTPWESDWPKTPIDVPDARSDKGEPSSIPTCTNCPFNIQWRKSNYCVCPACYAVKLRLWQGKKNAQDASDRMLIGRNGKLTNVPANRGVSDWERKEKERRKQLNADNKASRILIAAAVPTIATTLPDHPAVLDMIFKVIKFRSSMGSFEAEKKWKAATVNVKREMIAKVLITENVGIDPWKRTTPAHAKQSIEKLAASLKVKLPKDWAETPKPATTKKRTSK